MNCAPLVILQFQSLHASIVGSGNEQAMFVLNIQFMDTANKNIPSAIGLCLVNNKSEQTRCCCIHGSPHQNRFQLFEGRVYGKLGIVSDSGRRQGCDCLKPGIVQSSFEIVDGIAKDEGDVRKVAQFVEAVVNSLKSAFKICITPSSLIGWIYDSANSAIDFRDVFIGPLEL